jgi:small subunit ribosomal protein S9
MSDQTYFYGTGKRKTAIAQIRLFPGNGNITINGKTLGNLIPSLVLQSRILAPLRVTGTLDNFNVIVKVKGGGLSGQADAIRHGISRALVRENEAFKPILRYHGFLTRDSRIKERKKYGLKRARKAPQYTKR